MMKKFILIVCGSFVGAFLAFMFFMFAAMVMSLAIMGSSMGGSKNLVNVTKHSILKVDLGTTIIERGGNESFDIKTMLLNDEMPNTLGLNTLLSAIENAADNEKIEGIYLECNGVDAAPAFLG